MNDGTIARARVFLSSVMEGYATFRDAAAEGVRRSGCDVVRAENFPAATASARTACLDGVRSADALVLLLGQRYGYVAPSGRSVTEEEYDEARRTHKRIFVFLEESATREPRQEELVRRVQDYVGGHWRKTFRDEASLTALVEQAIAEADMTGIESNAAAHRLDAALGRRPERTQGIVWVHAAWATVRDEEVVDPLSLGQSVFQQTLQRLAHESNPPLFRYEEAKRKNIMASRLRIEQGDRDTWRESRDLVVLELDADGTLSIALNVSGTEPEGELQDTHFGMYFLDPDVFRQQLARASAFAASWWEHHDTYRRHDPLEYVLALHDVEARYFSKPTRSASGGITVPANCPTNPLLVFDRPRTIARGDLGNPSAEIDRACQMVGRRFQEWKNRW
jgi:hypothetical protein